MINDQRRFVHDLIAELLNIPKPSVIWANQNNMPRPMKAYAMLRLYNAQREAAEELRPTDTPGIMTIVVPTSAMLEVQFTDNQKQNPLETLERMVRGLEKPTVADRCQAARVAFFNAGPVQDVSFTLGAVAWEHRAAVDLSVRYMSEMTDDVGYIETVEIDGTLTEPTSTPKMKIDLTVKGENSNG
ncbi:LIC_12616 family protein [Megasphaera stantonii]|uniref:Phage neck terminator protein gp12-like domain-containing protein n=1 Tax=Megasphaera stantonii TaxID=2144175 RepID=A0A346B171_9FIRM|nr:hypothetical protein [Megasphaera stantonii]AXL21864.1 hypothetical protein DKB62_09980 [Megasphaera stantonii]